MERTKKASAVKSTASSPPREAAVNDVIGARRLALIALFVVSAAGLVFEITLTRLFSLFFEYHFTFLAVSLAVSIVGPKGEGAMLTNILSAVFFLVSMFFVRRSFYGMRIESEK